MIVISARNAHQMLAKVLVELQAKGINSDSRNGNVRLFSEPVTLKYELPRERVIFWAMRDANPFFHFMECLWMMAGSDDLESIQYYCQNLRSFSDDGITLNGAYGYRWRNYFDHDQIRGAIYNLRENPNCRRQVVAMWDPKEDFGSKSLDIPCNTHIYFQIIKGKLHMMVCNRSNDIVWGAVGANVVHFSFLHEFMANSLEVPVGPYWQTSMNMHLYDSYRELMETMTLLNNPAYGDYYQTGAVKPVPRLVCISPEKFIAECEFLMDEGPVNIGFKEPYIRNAAIPLMKAWEVWKEKDAPITQRYAHALELVEECYAEDWRKACEEWLTRRYHRGVQNA